jgi:hypothetical protein
MQKYRNLLFHTEVKLDVSPSWKYVVLGYSDKRLLRKISEPLPDKIRRSEPHQATLSKGQ